MSEPSPAVLKKVGKSLCTEQIFNKVCFTNGYIISDRIRTVMDTIRHEHDVHVHHLSGNRDHQTNKTRLPGFKLAISATIHCLIGCGLGEVLGMILSSTFHLNNLYSVVLSIITGFIGGLLLGILPLRKIGFTLGKALKTVLVGEGLSIAVMEAFELITQASIPGVMDAHLTESLFWLGMIVSLFAGFIAALPVNYIMIKRGVRHLH